MLDYAGNMTQEGMTMHAGTKAYGTLVLDRESGLSHRLHDSCYAELSEMLRSAGVNPMARLAPMGPGTAQASDPCDLTTCGRPMGEE